MNGAVNYWRSVIHDATTDTVTVPRLLLLDLFAELDKAEAHQLESARVRTLDEARADRPRYKDRRGW